MTKFIGYISLRCILLITYVGRWIRLFQAFDRQNYFLETGEGFFKGKFYIQIEMQLYQRKYVSLKKTLSIWKPKMFLLCKIFEFWNPSSSVWRSRTKLMQMHTHAHKVALITVN